MTTDNESPFVLEPVHRALGGEPALAPLPAAASYRTELEGPFELEALTEPPPPWRPEPEGPEPMQEQLAPTDYAAAALAASRAAALRNNMPGDARFRTRPPTVPGTTLDVAYTRAELGDAGTTYNLTGGAALAASLMSGDRSARVFYCSGLSIWTLAAVGYDVAKPLVGADGQPFTWTRVAGTTTEVAVTLKQIIDGEPEAVEAMTLAARNNMTSGGSVGRLGGAGHTIGHGTGGDALAVKGAPGAFRLAGIGTEVPELDQKPGDFAQSRRTTRVQGETVLKHWGAGHAWQVWSVRARGSAMFGKPGSPRSVGPQALDGWHDGVEFVIDKDTQPALVGPHTVLAARRIEANVAGAGTLLKGGDGGVQVTIEQPVPDTGRNYTGYVVYYGRLGTSPWATWKPAAPASHETNEEAWLPSLPALPSLPSWPWPRATTPSSPPPPAPVPASPPAGALPSVDERAMVDGLVARGVGGGKPEPLADIIFYARHRELAGKGVPAGNTALVAEWGRIRDDIVRPSLLGILSEKYESAKGGPGTVSGGAGDPGGVSYGTYQLSSKRGTAAVYAKQSAYAAELAGLAPGTDAFSAQWRAIAAREPDAFWFSQWQFIKATHYDPLALAAKGINLDATARSRTLRQVLWSTAVQHGPSGAYSTVLQPAFAGKDVRTIDDAGVIRAIYVERGRTNADGTLAHFGGVSATWIPMLRDRFKNEQNEALAMLDAEHH